MHRTLLRLHSRSTGTHKKVSLYCLYYQIVFDLIKDFDADKDSKVSFGEFVSALWTLEKRDEQLEMIQSGSTNSLPQFSFQPMGISELKVSLPICNRHRKKQRMN